ncbi:hypothetical protein HO173_010718 [Letharia columbiana]|uniref:Cytochrome P450 n=1 Tax=Letharia columbiana TaxID=112416 RepID=A0A8H6FM20_9LECA|nr:uncharacterized protein HO173_010718 [Letharia columbiana]KAF6231018.1 hypothetical protein HO173_010718 [Letharia columbiana]
MSFSASVEQGTYTYGLTNFSSVRLFVLVAFCSFWIYRYVLRAAKYRADIEFGRLNDCQPPAFILSYKWPLALDIVKRGFKAGRQKKLLSLFTEYFDQLGPTVELTILGGIGFATMDPENIEAVLSTHFEDFHLGPRNKAMMAMIGEGIFTQDGPAWKHSRELLRRQFVRMQYQNLEGFREHVENLVDTVNNSPGIVDLQPYFYRLTLNTTIAMILGQSVESFNHEIGDLFSKAFNKASLVTATRVRLGDLYFLYAPKGFFAACKTVKDYTDQFVRDALRQDRGNAEISDKYTFINDLQNEHQDVRLVRDQVINVLIAGRDTTAATMSYVFRLLVRHPHVLKKLRGEIESVLGQDNNITRAYIQRMPYLQHVIKETLRLYPPVPINTRFCKQASTLPLGGGPDGRSPVLVREGMPVAYSVYHMHRRKDIYGSDAGSFRPERWEGSELSDIKWGYLPFNGGPRLCLGKDFGLMLASYGIARMIQAYPKIELAPGETWEEPGAERQHLTLTLSNADGCKVLLAR